MLLRGFRGGWGRWFGSVELFSFISACGGVGFISLGVCFVEIPWVWFFWDWSEGITLEQGRVGRGFKVARASFWTSRFLQAD